MFEELLSLKPEYIHVLLQAYITHAIPMLALGLAVALIARSTAGRVIFIALIALCTALTYPVEEFGEAGYDRMSAVLNDDSQAWLDKHEERAKSVIPLFYVTAGVALASLLLPLKWKKLAIPSAVTTLVLAGACTAAAGYVAYAGGKVSHPEFRPKTAAAQHSTSPDTAPSQDNDD